ncbi:chemoreceptor glutamine deamidase CheD [Vibrio vulnificus]|nr:chemoreceptor glutamine deamidase CheD [Vibrio vulnificus]
MMLDSINHHFQAHEEAYYSRFFNEQRGLHMIKVLPGGVYVSGQEELICTGLGSCVSACIWDPVKRVGGMNHFLLPFHNHFEEKHWHADELLSGASRYGSYAMEMLLNQLLSLGARRERLRMKLFGGAQMMGFHSMIGEKNVEFVLHYAEQEGLEVVAYDLGGLEPRKIMFDPLTGKAWLKRIPFAEINHLRREEERYAHTLEKQTDTGSEVELF